jgi:PAS domain S-box-containing protein
MKLNRIAHFIRSRISSIFAILFFLLLLSISYYYISYKRGQWEKDIRANLLEILIGKKSKLEKALSSRIYYTKGVAAFVSVNPNLTNEDFYQLAKELIKEDSVISTISISPDCILSAIYPQEGHMAAIGLNLLEHPARKEIVEKTIETHKTFVAGPVELVEGGVAFISYTPVFNRLSARDGDFWGITDIVIYKDKLLDEAELAPVDNGFRYSLKGADGKGENGNVFWGDASVFQEEPVKIIVDLPDGSWILGASPVKGWSHYLDQDKTLSILLIVSSIIISFLFWLVVRAHQKIRRNARELSAIFKSMHNLIVEYNRKGEYVKIAPTNKSLLFKPEEELIGKSVHEVFDTDRANLILHAIQECIRSKSLVVIEYPLEVSGEPRWFTARLSYKSEDSVIFNAYDVTEKKKDEENIRQSEKKLKELNVTKDKFFSIIAHDLRNPLSNFQSISELLHQEYDHYNDEQKKQLIQSMLSSSISLNELLENLLKWSLSHRNELFLKPAKILLQPLVKEAIGGVEHIANKKQVVVESSIQEEATIFADKNATHTILRNLISNALKFSRTNGVITILANERSIDGENYQVVQVVDKGIGISKERLSNIFNVGVQSSTVGTSQEKGSGLGLILCQELTEKQGGRIWIESEEGKGTTVFFSLPKSTK